MSNDLGLRIHTLNVGQGDSQFIEIFNSRNEVVQLILIDVGNKGSFNKIVEYHQENFKKTNAMSATDEYYQVNTLIITHWDADHHQGLSEVISNQNYKLELEQVFGPLENSKYKCDIFYANKHFNSNLVSKFDISKNNFPENTIYSILKDKKNKDIEINIYAKNAKVVSFSGSVVLDHTEKNQSSIGILVKDNKTGFIYYTGGDLTELQEKKLANSSDPYPFIDSLKVSHHGSNGSSSNDFLASIKPRTKDNRLKTGLAILSHGNRHGHPHGDVMQRLANNNFVMISTSKIKKESKIPNICDLLILNSGHIVQEPTNTKNGQLNTIKASVTNYNSGKSVGNIYIYKEGVSNFSFRSDYSDNKTALWNFIRCLDESVKTDYDPTKSTCNIPNLPLEYPFSSKLDNCHIVDNGDSLGFTCDIENFDIGSIQEKFELKGAILKNELKATYKASVSSASKKVIDGADLDLRDVFNFLNFENYYYFDFLKLINGFIVIDEMSISHNYEFKNNTFVDISLQIASDIEINEKIKINSGFLKLYSLFSGGNESPLSFNDILLHTTIKIKNDLGEEKELQASMSLLNLPTTDLKIDIKDNINLANLVSIIPNFDNKKIENWCKSLELDRINLKKMSLQNNWGNYGRLEKFEIGFYVDLIKGKDIILDLSVFYGQKSTIISGALLQNVDLSGKSISLRYILDSMGFGINGLEFIPQTVLDLSISDLSFSANLSESKYSLHIELDTLFTFEQSLAKGKSVSLTVSKIELSIEKYENSTEVELILGAMFDTDKREADDIDENNIFLTANYNSEIKKFSIGLDLYDFDVLNITKLVNIEPPTEYFSAEIKKLSIKFNPFLLYTELVVGFSRNILSTTLTFKITTFEVDEESKVKYSGYVIFLGVNTEFTQTIGRSAKDNIIKISIKKLNLSDVIDYFLRNPELSKHFKLDINALEITIDNEGFKLHSQIENFSLGEVISITDNVLDFNIGKAPEISISTKLLEVKAFDNTFSAQGGLAVSSKGVSFYGGTVGQIENIFGVKGLGLDQFFISLNQTYTPPAFAVGFIGKLSYTADSGKKFSGSTAIYFSPNIPNEQLLAVNFNEIRLSDIVYSVLDLKGNDGIKGIIESISIESLEFANELEENTDVTKLKEIVISHDPDTKSNDLDLIDHNTYGWIEKGNYILENKNKFRMYFFSKNTEGSAIGKYKLSKYVSLYACTSANGISLNEATFEAGFAFSGNLNFLGVSQVVNFSANPKEGMFLYYEMDKSIQLPLGSGNLIKLSRMEDDRKGPILSLSTYDKNRHFYLSAKLVVLNGLLNFATRILMENNHISFLLYHEVMGFKTSIYVSSSFGKFENANIELQLKFVSSGFSDITSIIKQELYNISDSLNRRTNEAKAKVELVKTELEKYTKNIKETSNKLDVKYRDLASLKKISYPWYKAYKYIELGIRIASVGVDIAVLLAYRLGQIGLLEATLAMLDLVQAMLDASQEISESVIKRIGDVIAGIGQGLDWVIRIEKIEAELKVSLDSRSFYIKPDIRLFGGEKSAIEDFYIEHNGNLYEELIKKIKKELKLNYTGDNFKGIIDDVYGPHARLDYSLYNGTFDDFKQQDEDELKRFNSYRNLELAESIDVLFDAFDPSDNSNIAELTNQFDSTLIEEIEENLKDVNLSLKDESFFADEVKLKTQFALNDIKNELSESFSKLQFSNNIEYQNLKRISDIAEDKIVQYGDIVTHAKVLRENNINDTEKLINKLGTFAKKIDSFKNHDLKNIHYQVEQDHDEQLDQEVSEEIIQKYKTIGEDNKLSPYYKIIFLTNAGVGLATLGKRDDSIESFTTALNYARETMGLDSHEESVINNLMLHYWNIGLGEG